MPPEAKWGLSADDDGVNISRAKEADEEVDGEVDGEVEAEAATSSKDGAPISRAYMALTAANLAETSLSLAWEARKMCGKEVQEWKQDAERVL